ncbi:phosphate ABC transporter permease PstA [Alicyclobacillus curvatus]|nr:phosphate ABC transporter permease PstA [Alicyclobacillus curvatus]
MQWRKAKNRIFSTAIIALSLLAVLPLFLILGYVIYRGLPGLNLSFFTRLPAPTGIPGGMANAVVGSLEIVFVASLISLPVGIGAGLFLSEFRVPRVQSVIRFFSDVLSGVPSIVIGLLAYALVVAPMGGFSGLSGSIALAVLMIPTIARSSEQVLRLVPVSIREAALSLGARRTQVWLRAVLPTAMSGLITGFLLAVSRALGETAPLLFTAFGNQFWSNNLLKPTAALPLQVFVYAISPYQDWQQEAWTGALTLVLIALAINVLARLGTRAVK